MDGAKTKKKGDLSNSGYKEVEVSYKHFLPNRKTILNKLKAKKRYSHKHFQKQKSQEETSKMKSKLTTKEVVQSKERERRATDEVKPSQDSIARFYMQERKKLNIWTFLFQKLYTSFNQILKMCEIERKVEFCRGIEETLTNFLHETQKVARSLKVEEQSTAKSTAWEIRPQLKKDSVTLNDLSRIDEKKVDLQFDDKGEVEFKLLSELVSEGKMSFYEAIVLIIRERAALFDMLYEEESVREMTIREELSMSRGSFGMSRGRESVADTPKRGKGEVRSEAGGKIRFTQSIEDFSKNELKEDREGQILQAFVVQSEKKINSLGKTN